MIRFNYLLAIVLMVSPIICGCGSSGKQGSATEQTQQLITGLRSELEQARKELDSQTELNRSLEDQVQSLAGKLDEIEKQVPQNASTLDSQATSSSGALDSQSRVALMGAKALAEFKAEQLSAKLEKLTKESLAREGELVKSSESLESLSGQISQLKNSLQEKTEQFDSIVRGKTAQINQLGLEVKNLTEQITDFRQDVSEKDELLVTLKKAWSDATQLKTAAESDVSRLKTELETMARQSATYKEAAERGSQEATFLKAELEQARERLDSTTAQLEKLTNENLLSNTEIERLKAHSANLANKLYALERAAGVDSENFVTSLDRIMSGTFSGTPQQIMAR